MQDEPANMGPWPHYGSTSRPSSTCQVQPCLAPPRPPPSVGHAQPPRRGAEGADGSGLRRLGRGCDRVLHRPRHRGAREAPGRRGGHPGLARRAAPGVHRRVTRSSRRPSSGSPPGWPGSTTPTTSDRPRPPAGGGRAPPDVVRPWPRRSRRSRTCRTRAGAGGRCPLLVGEYGSSSPSTTFGDGVGHSPEGGTRSGGQTPARGPRCTGGYGWRRNSGPPRRPSCGAKAGTAGYDLPRRAGQEAPGEPAVRRR